MLGVLAWVGVGYLLWVGLLYTLQGMMLYPGTSRTDGGRGGQVHGYEPLDLGGVPPGRAWLLPAGKPGPNGAPLVIHSHGNGELIDDWFRPLSGYLELDVAVLLVEYPGYGGTEGDPSEESIRAAMRTAYDAAVARPDVDGSRVIVHGRSLGGGAACGLIRDRKVAGAVLESTFTSVTSMAARYLVPGFLVRDRFDNLGAIEAFEGPVLVLHGTRDAVIPFSHGEKLAAAAKRSTFVERSCGHNDCPMSRKGFWEPIGRLVDEVRR